MYSSTPGSLARSAATSASAARATPPAPPRLAVKRQLASLYRDFAHLPVSVNAIFGTPKKDSVVLTTSQRDLGSDTFRKWQQTLLPTSGSDSYEAVSFPIEVAGVIASVRSPSRRFTAVLRATEKKSALSPGGSGAPPPAPASGALIGGPATPGKAYWIDIYSPRGLVSSTSLDSVHGRVYTGVPFGSMAWSEEEDAIVYCAEPHPPQRRSLFEGLAHGPQAGAPASGVTPAAAAAAEADTLGGTGTDWAADWGEQLSGAVSPSLYLFDVATRGIVKLPGVPEPAVLSTAFPTWVYPSSKGSDSSKGSKSERGIAFIGYPVTPRRFGLIYYNSRPSQVFYVPAPAQGHVAALAARAAGATGSSVAGAPPAKATATAPAAAPTATGAPATGAASPATAAPAASPSALASAADSAQCLGKDATPITTVCLTPDDVAVDGLWRSPDGAYLAFFGTSLSGEDAPVHCTTSSLRAIPIPASLSAFAPAPEDGSASKGGEECKGEGKSPVAPTQAGSWCPAPAPLPVSPPAVMTVVPVPDPAAVNAASAGDNKSKGHQALADSAFPGFYPGAADPDGPSLFASPTTALFSSLWRSEQALVIVSAPEGLGNGPAAVVKVLLQASDLPPSLQPAPVPEAVAAAAGKVEDDKGKGLGKVVGSAPSVSVLDIVGDGKGGAKVLLSVSQTHVAPAVFSLSLPASLLNASTLEAASAAPSARVPPTSSPAAAAFVPHTEVTLGALRAAGAAWELVSFSALEAASLPAEEGGFAESAAEAAAEAALGELGLTLTSPSLTRPAPAAAAPAAAAAEGKPASTQAKAVWVPRRREWAALVEGVRTVTAHVAHSHAWNLDGKEGVLPQASDIAPEDAPVPEQDAEPHFETLVTWHPTRFASATLSKGESKGADKDDGDDSSRTAPPLRGVVLFPHGGPHSAFSTSYDFSTAYLASAGLAVVRPNYRGSVGFGQGPLAGLAGRCGRRDVDDCVAAYHAGVRVLAASLAEQEGGAEAALDKVSSLPVFLFGGSHGGYLVTHLAGQSPQLGLPVAAVVARNAVISLPFTVGTSDIMDWCFTEAGVRFSPQYSLNAASIARMWETSPLAYADGYTAPTLLAIGTADRRVPPEQSIDFYRLLQAKGVPARVSVYHGAQHGLNDKPLIHADSVVSAALWFAQFGGDTTVNVVE